MDLYKPVSPIGACIYESFSDDELKEILTEFFASSGRCPAQKEIYLIYRQYIRARFGNWPWALQAAGLKERKPASTGNRSGRHRNAREKAINKRRKV